MPSTVAIVLCMVGLTATSGCLSGSDDTNVVVEETAGVRTVTTVRSAWDDVLDLPIEVLYQGRTETVVDLSDVREGVLLSDGGAAVMDRRLRSVVRLDADGRVVWVRGREGAGPGEFLAPVTLGRLPGDSVVVYDPRTSRLTLLADGEQAPVVKSLGSIADGAIDVWRLPDGRMASFEGGRRAAELITEGRDADLIGARAVVRVLDLESGLADTVFAEGVSREMVRAGSMYLMAAFGRSTRVDVQGQEIAVAPSDGFRVLRVESSGVRTAAQMPNAARSLEMTEVERLRDSLRAEIAAAGEPNIGDVVFSAELQPDMRPAFSAVHLAPSGRILLREFSPLLRRSDVWWIVSASGAFQGRVRLPPRTDVLDLGDDAILAVRLDQFDVPSIEVWRVDWERLPGFE